MHIENTTEDVINVFLGIGVPARGTLPVSLEMHNVVKTSPLIADYVAAGALIVHEDAAPEKAAPAVAHATVVKDK